jgi:hypothetical protein
MSFYLFLREGRSRWTVFTPEKARIGVLPGVFFPTYKSSGRSKDPQGQVI